MDHATLIKDNFYSIKRLSKTAAYKYYLGNQADEVFSQVLEKLWKYRIHFDGSNFLGWCNTLIFRTALDIRRMESTRMKYTYDTVDLPLYEHILSNYRDTASTIDDSDSRQLIMDLINKTYGEVAVLMVRHLQLGYNYKETGDSLKINKGTVWSRVHAIKTMIAKVHPCHL